MSSQSLDVAGLTDVGRVRKQNEDAFVISDGVWVVADGLGGHAGGEVASDVAARAAAQVLASGRADSPSPRQLLTRAFQDAHAAIRAAASRDGLADMGTTLVAGYRGDDGQVHLGSVGDSRAYLLSGDGLRRLTTDDNEAEEMVSLGLLTADQARTHPGQFSLTKALLAYQVNAPAPQVEVVDRAGRLLLCSDGLMAELDDQQIGALLGPGTPQDAAQALVRATLDAGASDNVTVVVVDL